MRSQACRLCAEVPWDALTSTGELGAVEPERPRTLAPPPLQAGSATALTRAPGRRDQMGGGDNSAPKRSLLPPRVSTLSDSYGHRVPVWEAYWLLR